MADPGTTLQHHRTVFDGWRSISLSLYMALVGYGVLVGIPVISTAWVELLGFTEVQVGRVAGADLGGLSLGAILTSLAIRTMNRRHLVVLGVALAVIVGMLATGIGNIKVMLSLFLFNTLWIFVDVYQMATVANVDHSGKYASLMPGAQGLGQIVGPNIAASILAAGLGYSAVFIMCGTMALIGLSIYALMYVRLHKTIPALADAS